MLYINDWDKRKARHEAFWQQEVIDRPLITFMGPNAHINVMDFDASIMVPPKGGSHEEMMKFYTDPETILKRHRYEWDNLTWLGDKLPIVWLSMGIPGHALFFKDADYGFTDDSMWVHGEYQSNPKMEYERNGYWYKKNLEVAKAIVKEAKGEFLVSMPDVTGNLDALGAIQGSDRVMMDMYTGEDYIHPALDKLQVAWEDFYKDFYPIVEENNHGGSGVGWMRVWGPGKTAQLQHDMSVMFSANMYEKYALPELQRQSEFLDNAIYHLDGQEQIRHLDHILSVDGIKAIQWQNVAGQPSCVENMEALKRIQAAGKSLLLFLNTPADIQPLMENLSSKGLQFFVPMYTGEEDCKKVLQMMEHLTHE